MRGTETYCSTCFDSLGCEDDAEHGIILGASAELVRCAHCDYSVTVYVDGVMISDADSYNTPNACTVEALRTAIERAKHA